MLYIPVEVNNVSVKAFVDSGAQATIMSTRCAEKCNILRLIDKRFAGMAHGVGTAKILGRVHRAQIKIGNYFFDCSFTVMEDKKVDLLLGLDMLKRHQACIDLQKGVLRINEAEVSFLGEADLPKAEEQALEDEPMVPGPGGMEIGAISGAVKPSEEVAKQKAKEATPAPQAPPSGASSSRPAFSEDAIARLMDLGFSRDQAIHGLEMAGGNVDIAAGILMG